MSTLITKIETGDVPVYLHRDKKPGRYVVHYGQQVSRDLSYEKAAKELGECILHGLACAGTLDAPTTAKELDERLKSAVEPSAPKRVPTPFEKALAANIRSAVRILKSQGITSISLANLLQTVLTPSPFLEGAPAGRDARQVYREEFEATVKLVVPKKFIIEN